MSPKVHFQSCFQLHFFVGLNADASITESEDDPHCIEPSLPCNCDAKLPIWQFDEGFINDETLLPITEFAYGPLEYDLEEAKVSIGSLKCSGTLSTSSCTSGPAPVAPPKVLRDDCDMITLEESENRVRIDIPYRNGQHCWMVVDFPKPDLKVTFESFHVSIFFWKEKIEPNLIFSTD